MLKLAIYNQRYTCGQHVTGHGRHISTHGEAIPLKSGKELRIKRGVITMLPSKRGEPYTVLDEETFIVLEAQEEGLTPLS